MHAHEKLLREECGYTGAQPYWDEEKEAGEFSKSKIFDPKYGFGGDGTGPGGCIETGRFASYIVSSSSFPLGSIRFLTGASQQLHTGPSYENTKHCLTRQISDSASSYASKELVKNCIAFPDFKTAWPCIALNPHYAGHTGVGGEMADAISRLVTVHAIFSI
jgi:tyrosinase